jgi:hypothetical protein
MFVTQYHLKLGEVRKTVTETKRNRHMIYIALLWKNFRVSSSSLNSSVWSNTIENKKSFMIFYQFNFF